jgi:tRNA(Ile)-lysidine synthase
MPSMTNLKCLIEQNWNFLSAKKNFVACSAGVDSTTLLSIFKSLGWHVEAIHVNYHLRGEDSNKDQQHIELFCKKNNIPFHLKSIDLGKQLKEKKGNLQEEARKVRYEFFETFIQQCEDNYIILGHHIDDQIETFLMHLARKSGIMGMSCMLPLNNQYARPFLTIKKDEIISYATSQNIEWREDVTNQTNKYTRNILRNILIPKLKKLHPNIDQDIQLLIYKFQDNQKILEEKIKPIQETIIEKNFLAFEIFDHLSENETNELLRALGVTSNYLTEIKKLRNSQRGKFIKLKKETPFQSIHFDNDGFNFISKQSVTKKKPELIIEEVSSLPTNFNTHEIYVDPNQLKGDLILRKWEVGDRMKPIGLKGSKLISDIIKDAKIPSHLKSDVLVLTDSEVIIWCVNIKVGANANANEKSDKIWKISVR